MQRLRAAVVGVTFVIALVGAPASAGAMTCEQNIVRDDGLVCSVVMTVVGTVCRSRCM